MHIRKRTDQADQCDRVGGEVRTNQPNPPGFGPVYKYNDDKTVK